MHATTIRSIASLYWILPIIRYSTANVFQNLLKIFFKQFLQFSTFLLLKSKNWTTEKFSFSQAPFSFSVCEKIFSSLKSLKLTCRTSSRWTNPRQQGTTSSNTVRSQKSVTFAQRFSAVGGCWSKPHLPACFVKLMNASSFDDVEVINNTASPKKFSHSFSTPLGFNGVFEAEKMLFHSTTCYLVWWLESCQRSDGSHFFLSRLCLPFHQVQRTQPLWHLKISRRWPCLIGSHTQTYRPLYMSYVW